MRGFAFGLLLVVWMAGCAIGTQVAATSIVLRSYELGQIRTAAIGDPIFDVQAGRVAPAFRVIREHSPGGDLNDLRPGMIFRAVREYEGDLFLVRNRDWSATGGVIVSSDGVIDSYLVNGIRSRRESGPSTPIFESAEIVEGAPNAFRAQLLYSGLDGNTVRAVYREFLGDFIRPAFSQELQFDLDESNVIGFRTIQIEVIEAMNAQIRYRVVSDGDLPWLPVGEPTGN